MGKRIVVCCDGTWNTARQRNTTNVTKFRELVAPTDADGVTQRVFYHAGVGTSPRERYLGGIFGIGLSRIVREVYRMVVDEYEPGDDLYLLGFSRGAFTARSTVGFIRNAGILRREHADRIDEAYALYRNAEGPDAPGAVAFRAAYSVSDRVPIRFVGVWDTVGALGVPNIWPGVSRLNQRYAFHNVELSRTVQSAYQALAIDEARKAFVPTLWKAQPHVDGQQVEQVWFAGCHCDVGGGLAGHDLSDVTLAWMVDRAQRCGLAFSAVSPFEPSWVEGDVHESRKGLYRLMRAHHRPLGAVDATVESAASTVVQRADYRPVNLETYLRGTYRETPIVPRPAGSARETAPSA